MFLSDRTLKILEMFYKLNDKLYIRKGSLICNMEQNNKSVLSAKVEDEFLEDIPLYDFKKFLANMKQMKNPNIEILMDYILFNRGVTRTRIKTFEMLMTEYKKSQEKAKRITSDNFLQEHTNNKIVYGKPSCKFNLSQNLLKELLGNTEHDLDMMVETSKSDNSIYLKLGTRKLDYYLFKLTDEMYSIKVGEGVEKDDQYFLIPPAYFKLLITSLVPVWDVSLYEWGDEKQYAKGFTFVESPDKSIRHITSIQYGSN
jgi:hypothetical protein